MNSDNGWCWLEDTRPHITTAWMLVAASCSVDATLHQILDALKKLKKWGKKDFAFLRKSDLKQKNPHRKYWKTEKVVTGSSDLCLEEILMFDLKILSILVVE